MNDMTCDPKTVMISPIHEKAALWCELTEKRDHKSSHSRFDDNFIHRLKISHYLEQGLNCVEHRPRLSAHIQQYEASSDEVPYGSPWLWVVFSSREYLDEGFFQC